ncbi:hypothetical protein D3C73_580010 [compost metagenome]
MAKPLEIDEVWVERITQILSGMEYGTVQIVVHDGKITQIDRTERKRFEASSHLHAVKSSDKSHK